MKATIYKAQVARYSKRIARSVGTISAAFFVLLTLAASAQTEKLPINQHRVNEIAAACESAQIALRGLSARRRPGEQPAQYKTRITGYLTALDTVEERTIEIRRVPALRDNRPANVQLWQRISKGATALPAQVSAAKAAWAALPKEKQPVKLGASLLRALTTVQAILGGLRDAHP